MAANGRIYNPHSWQHGDIITAQKLNELESAVSANATNTYAVSSYDTTSGDADLGSTDNPIATKASVTRAIEDLNSTLTLSQATDDVSGTQSYRRVLTSIEEKNGKLYALKALTIPVASSAALGLIKVGDNLSINADTGLLSGSYVTDQVYDGRETINSETNNAFNPLATVKTVNYGIGSAIPTTMATVNISGTETPYANGQLTISAFTGNTSNGTITVTRVPISITSSQVNDKDSAIVTIQNEAGYNATSTNIPTTAAVVDYVTSEISAINTTIGNISVTGINGLSGGGTFSSNHNSINISHTTPSGATSGVHGTSGGRTYIQTITTDAYGHLTGFTTATETVTDTTYSAATTSTNGLMSSTDKAKLDALNVDTNNNSITLGGVTLTPTQLQALINMIPQGE